LYCLNIGKAVRMEKVKIGEGVERVDKTKTGGSVESVGGNTMA